MENRITPINYTAFRVMFHVALEQYQLDSHRIIQDNLARQMLPGRLQLLLSIFGFKPLRQGFFDLIEKGFPGTLGGLCRKRYIDDQLAEEVSNGIDNVVILGSGLDTRAYRLPKFPILKVYEVDLPQVIAYKESKLRQLYGGVPAHVRLVPIDFDRQTLEDVMVRHGYLPDQKSFFIWEGVTQYLPEAGVRRIFDFLTKVRPGSRLVFTYILKDFIDGKRAYGLGRLYRQTRVMWHFGLQPAQVAEFIGEYSWKELEQVGADEYRQRYLEPAGRMEVAMEIERAVYAEKTTNQPVRHPAD